MNLKPEEKFFILTWMPTAVTYLVGDTQDALIMLGGNVNGLALYFYRDAIRSNQKIMGFTKNILDMEVCHV